MICKVASTITLTACVYQGRLTASHPKTVIRRIKVQGMNLLTDCYLHNGNQIERRPDIRLIWLPAEHDV
jgi:hypothetical protein